MKQLAVSEGKAIEAVVKANVYELQLIANDERVVNYILAADSNEGEKNAISDYLRECLVPESDYEVCLINSLGDVLASSSKEQGPSRISHTEVFKQVMKGETVFKNIIDANYNSGKVISITVPVKNEKDNVIGAVCRMMNSKVLNELEESIQVNEKEYVYIVDENLEVILHPHVEKEGLAIESAALKKMIGEYNQSEKREGSYTYAVNKEERYVSFYLIQDIGWTICIEQSVADMQKQAVVGSAFIIGTLIILIIMITVGSRRMVNQIITPIDMLIETMGRVAKGDLSSYCTYDANDEFGELSKHYNNMIKKLEESKQALMASEDRYKVALEAIEQVVWEYRIGEDKFIATENWNKIIGQKIDMGYMNDLLDNGIESKCIEGMKKKIDDCLNGKTQDFTHDIWIKKEDINCCLLCKGHAVMNSEGKVEKLVGILTDITDDKYNEERMRKLTFFDELTGCLNKATFIETVDEFILQASEHQRGVLLFVDLDDFKKVNDVLSHDIGDKVLNYIAKKITEVLPQDTLVGRFGGDEFVIFKSLENGMDEVHEMIYNLLNLFQNKVALEEANNVHLTCSIGIALYPNDGKDSGALLKNADTAMYKVKETGKNSYSFYTKAMSQQLDRKLLVEEAVREAIGKNSFYLQYQPVVDLNSGYTTGCEALIRLVDDKLGFVSPGEFIPIAEETDLIIETGDWVLDKALTTLKALHDKGYSGFTMNINVSSAQIKEEDFVQKLSEVIQKVGVLPQCIKLEVTESVVMEQVEKSIELFNQIKALGIKIALDDFGTGYSSLNYLRSIPFDILKIDKSFVDEITTSKELSEIVDSIIAMAHALNIVVVAEGVEDEMQLEVLRRKGCDYIQGYYYSKPLNEEKLEERLKEEKCDK